MFMLFFFSSRRRHTRFSRDWSSDVCSSDLVLEPLAPGNDLAPTGSDACLESEQPPVGEFDEKATFDSDVHRRDGRFAVRLGLAGVLSIGELTTAEPGRRVRAAGVVTHRQRPATAGGVTFLNLEDETGMINVICTAGLWTRYRRIARTSPALLVRGMVENAEGAISLLADRLEHLDLRIPGKSRDFR